MNSNKNKEAKELQALAFGGASKKKSNKKKSGQTSGKDANPDQQQFEDWKVKDVEVGSDLCLIVALFQFDSGQDPSKDKEHTWSFYNETI